MTQGAEGIEGPEQGGHSVKLPGVFEPSMERALRRTVPFADAWSKLHQPNYRRLILSWMILVLAVAPTGMMTRLFGWTGLPMTLGGVDFFVTIYLPVLICVPLVFWLGYLWAAILAYLSSFLVALLGGMPIGWILVFAFANPIGLAVPAIVYRSIPARTDLRTLPSALLFIVVMFVSSLAGSGGALIWAHTNNVGLNALYPVWQGWWIGGSLQAIVVCGPLLAIATPWVEAAKIRAGLRTVRQAFPTRRSLLAPSLLFTIAVAGYVFVVFNFSLSSLEGILQRIEEPGLRDEVTNLFDSLSLPQAVLLIFTLFMIFFSYRIGVVWVGSLRGWGESLAALNAELEEKNLRLAELTQTDQLTGAKSRAFLLEQAARELSTLRRHGGDLACLMIDVDRFKSVNDAHGHLVGDHVLVTVVGRIQRALRREDILARYGGEEFAVLLSDTGPQEAEIICEKLRVVVGNEPITCEGMEIFITVSLGYANWSTRPTPEHIHELIRRADDALLQAKRAGRNRIVRESSTENPLPRILCQESLVNTIHH